MPASSVKAATSDAHAAGGFAGDQRGIVGRLSAGFAAGALMANE
jgi:hypothetical protein